MTERLQVAMPILQDCPLFELAVPCEVFGRDRRDLSPRWYELTLCQAEAGPQLSREGVSLEVWKRLDAIRTADLVIVPACDSPASYDPPAVLMDALREAHHNGIPIAAICSGAFMLAAAGLLDGRPATTHWMYAEELRRRYPRVQVRERALYVDDGAILTSAGTAAGIDLCLHIVRRDFGAAVAAEVGRRMVIAPHREGDQAQYVSPRRTDASPAHGLGPVLEWATQRLGEPLTVAQLARRAAMSTRTFGRHFARQLGITPLRWLNQQRLARACQLLETTNQSVDAIAERTGFSNGSLLRQHFHRELATTPTAYRRTFAATPAPGPAGERRAG